MEEKVEIFFSDLNKDTQKKILEASNISKPEDMNWDIVPIAVLPVPSKIN